MESPVSVNRQQEMAAAAMEALKQQTAAFDLHIEGAVDAVEKSLSLLILRWRSKRLTEAWASYEQALATLLAKVADVELRDQAKAQWRLLRDHSNEVWEQIETLIEAKAEEKVSDKQDLVVNGAIKPFVDSGETAKAEVVVEMLAKAKAEEKVGDKQDLVVNGAIKPLVEEEKLQEIGAKQDLVKSGAKQDLVEIGGVKPLLDPGEAAEVKIEEIGAKDELEECCIAEVVVKESATEVEDKSCTAKAEVVVEMLAKDQVEKFCATKVELEKRCIAKVEVEEPRANQDEMEFCAAKDAEFELLRFVMAGCRAQDNNGEYG